MISLLLLMTQLAHGSATISFVDKTYANGKGVGIGAARLIGSADQEKRFLEKNPNWWKANFTSGGFLEITLMDGSTATKRVFRIMLHDGELDAAHDFVEAMNQVDGMTVQFVKSDLEPELSDGLEIFPKPRRIRVETYNLIGLCTSRDQIKVLAPGTARAVSICGRSNPEPQLNNAIAQTLKPVEEAANPLLSALAFIQDTAYRPIPPTAPAVAPATILAPQQPAARPTSATKPANSARPRSDHK